MAKIVATDREGIVHSFEGKNGVSVMVNLRDTARLPILAICGGSCSCATCHIYVDEQWVGKVPAPEPDETELVAESEYYKANTSRLSCQIEFSDALDGLQITLAPED